MPSDPRAGAFGNDLTLSVGLRDELGLRRDESVRVLHAGGSTLLLERDCSESPVPIPWDRDLVMSADVRSFPLADILSMIHGAAKSGFVYFRHADHEKSVYLHRGEVVFAASNQAADRIGESLLRAGLITLDQLRDAESAFSGSVRFGKVLVQKGVLTPRALWNGVKAQVEDIVRSLFAYTTGVVHFWEGELSPDNVVRLSLPTQRLIAEGLARRDDLFKLLARIEDPRVTLRRSGSPPVDLAANERALMDVLGDGRDFASACRAVGLDPLSGARAVQLLGLCGAVVIERSEEVAPRESGDRSRSADESIDALVLDHVKLLAELTAPIVAVDGHAEVARRLTSVLEDTAPRHPELLGGIEVGPGATLDPTELTRRAQRLRRDRTREVASALGELVAYLEFELRNHPKIEEPEHFLDAVADLRARIEV